MKNRDGIFIKNDLGEIQGPGRPNELGVFNDIRENLSVMAELHKLTPEGRRDSASLAVHSGLQVELSEEGFKKLQNAMTQSGVEIGEIKNIHDFKEEIMGIERKKLDDFKPNIEALVGEIKGDINQLARLGVSPDSNFLKVEDSQEIELGSVRGHLNIHFDSLNMSGGKQALDQNFGGALDDAQKVAVNVNKRKEAMQKALKEADLSGLDHMRPASPAAKGAEQAAGSLGAKISTPKKSSGRSRSR